MASSTKLSLIIFFACSLFAQGTLGEVICEKLAMEQCAYAVSSSGQRCKLEHDHTCKTSKVVAEGFAGYIETDECVKVCGVGREDNKNITAKHFTPDFLSHLCSPACNQKCPNILEVYFNIAAGEGIYLPALCEQKVAKKEKRSLAEAAPSPKAPGAAKPEAPAPGAAPEDSAPVPAGEGDFVPVTASGALAPESDSTPEADDQPPPNTPVDGEEPPPTHNSWF